MSVVGVRVGRCDLCGYSCDGTRCRAHADCGEPVYDQWKSLRIADSLSTGGARVDLLSFGGYGSPMDAAEQREAVQPSRERVA